MKYHLDEVQTEIKHITKALKEFLSNSRTLEFEEKLLKALYQFNQTYFPVPEYKYRLRQGNIDEARFGSEKEQEFLPIYQQLVKQYNIQLRQDQANNFLDKWYSQHIREEKNPKHFFFTPLCWVD